MISLTDELLNEIADEYVAKGNKSMTFEQYLEFKLNLLRGVAYYG